MDSSNFSILWNQAIDLYIERTGKDIRDPNSLDTPLKTMAGCRTSTEAGLLFKKMLEGLHAPQKAT